MLPTPTIALLGRMGKQLTARTYNLMLVADEFFRKMRPVLALKFKPTMSRWQRALLGADELLMPMYIAPRQQLAKSAQAPKSGHCVKFRKYGLPSMASATSHAKSVVSVSLAAYRVLPLPRAIPV